MILCDTNILIEFYKNNLSIVGELQSIGQRKLTISVITQAELYYGALNKAELRKIKRHLALLQPLSIDAAVSSKFMETYCLSHKLAIPDAMIAATAIVNSVPLYTLNLKDFRFITDLTLYQPSHSLPSTS